MFTDLRLIGGWEYLALNTIYYSCYVADGCVPAAVKLDPYEKWSNPIGIEIY